MNSKISSITQRLRNFRGGINRKPKNLRILSPVARFRQAIMDGSKLAISMTAVMMIAVIAGSYFLVQAWTANSPVSPDTGPITGGTEVTITGTDFPLPVVEDFGYSGTFVAPEAGTYKLEVWGAEGGSTSAPAGKGGYSRGEVYLEQDDILYVNVGGQGYRAANNTTFTGGGYNGGGSAQYQGGGGGGATDIRVSGGNLTDRILVAGGGGGAYHYYTYGSTGGGWGGGLTGNNGSGSSDYEYNKGGTQTAGGDDGSGPATPGTFGYGGNGGWRSWTVVVTSYGGSGGGGGGWFGGGGGNSNGGGGGGSGYVFTAESDKTGYGGNIPDSRFYLSNAMTIGNAIFPAPDGSAVIGNTGDGYARITLLDGINVTFDGIPATHVKVVDSNTIIATTPPHAPGAVDIVISDDFGSIPQTLSGAFTYYDVLTVSSICVTGSDPCVSNGSTAGGTNVTVTGTHFEFGTTVTFDSDNDPGTCTDVVVISRTELTCNTPAHAFGRVSITVDNGLSQFTLPFAFLFRDPMTLTSVSPSSGPMSGGQILTISGTSLQQQNHRFKSVAAASLATGLAIDEIGQLYKVGSSTAGLGSVESFSGGDIAPGTTFKEIAASNLGVYAAIDTDGNLYMWGSGSSNQIGNGFTANQTTPWKLNGGWPSSGIPDSTRFTKVALGNTHVLAIDTDGNVYAWGRNNRGQLGNNQAVSGMPGPNSTCDSMTLCSRPIIIDDLSGLDIVDIAAGIEYSMALDANGDLYTWGSGDNGKLGTGDTNDALAPTLINLGGTKLSKIHTSATSNASAAIDTDGNVWVWGANSNYDIGNGSGGSSSYDVLEPWQSPYLSNIVDVYVGANSGFAIDADGLVYVWGSNTAGGLGTGSMGDTYPTPYQLSCYLGTSTTCTGFLAVSVGGLWTYGIAVDGTLYGWGYMTLVTNSPSIPTDQNGTTCTLSGSSGKGEWAWSCLRPYTISPSLTFSVVLDPDGVPTPCNITEIAADNTYVKCRNGSHAPGTVDVRVNNGLEAVTITDGFTYLAPEIISVDPPSGPTAGGTIVTITGSGFGNFPTDSQIVKNTFVAPQYKFSLINDGSIFVSDTNGNVTEISNAEASGIIFTDIQESQTGIYALADDGALYYYSAADATFTDLDLAQYGVGAVMDFWAHSTVIPAIGSGAFVGMRDDTGQFYIFVDASDILMEEIELFETDLNTSCQIKDAAFFAGWTGGTSAWAVLCDDQTLYVSTWTYGVSMMNFDEYSLFGTAAENVVELGFVYDSYDNGNVAFIGLDNSGNAYVLGDTYTGFGNPPVQIINVETAPTGRFHNAMNFTAVGVNDEGFLMTDDAGNSFSLYYESGTAFITGGGNVSDEFGITGDIFRRIYSISYTDLVMYIGTRSGNYYSISVETGTATKLTFASVARTVDLGGAPCYIQSWTDSQIICKNTPHNAGTVDVNITLNGITFSDPNHQFTYIAPVITAIDPNRGPTTGEQVVTITGSGFGQYFSGAVVETAFVAPDTRFVLYDNGIIYAETAGNAPIEISEVAGTTFKDITAGGNGLYALSDEGDLWYYSIALGEFVNASAAFTEDTGLDLNITSDTIIVKSQIISGQDIYVDIVIAPDVTLDAGGLTFGLVMAMFMNDEIVDFIGSDVPITCSNILDVAIWHGGVAILCDDHKLYSFNSNPSWQIVDYDLTGTAAENIDAVILPLSVSGQDCYLYGTDAAGGIYTLLTDEFCVGDDVNNNGIYDEIFLDVTSVETNGMLFVDLADWMGGDTTTIAPPVSLRRLMNQYFIDPGADEVIDGAMLMYDDSDDSMWVIYNPNVLPFVARLGVVARQNDSPWVGAYVTPNPDSFGDFLTGTFNIVLENAAGEFYQMNIANELLGSYLSLPPEPINKLDFTNLSGSGMASSVDLGGAICDVLSPGDWTDTEIICSTGIHAAGVVDVNVNNGPYNSATLVNGYTYVDESAIAIESVCVVGSDPCQNFGPTTGGTDIVITGVGFGTNPVVTLDYEGSDPVECLNVRLVSDTSITCTTDEHAPGVVDVNVTNGGNPATWGPETNLETGEPTKGFMYVETTLTLGTLDTITLSPVLGGNVGETSLTLSAKTNFFNGYTISFNATSGDANLTCETDSDYKFTSSWVGPAALPTNMWGYQIGSSTLSSGWLAVPASATTIYSQSTPSANNGADFDQHEMWFGAKTDISQKPCLYTGSVTYNLSVQLNP